MKYRLLVLSILVMALLAGCTAQEALKVYEGADRPVNELVRVTIPETIEVMSIDGKELPTSLLRKNNQLVMLPGEHVMALRYVELFQTTADEHDIVRSRQAALRFQMVAGEQYKLQAPVQKGRDQARQFAVSPVFTLHDATGNQLAESSAIVSYAEASLLDTIGKAFKGNEVEPSTTMKTNVDLLKDVWGRSSQEEKTVFQQWLKEQEKKEQGKKE